MVQHHFHSYVKKNGKADDIQISEGMQVVIPTPPYHMSPDIFPEPERFKPTAGSARRAVAGGRPLHAIRRRTALLHRNGAAPAECKFVLAYVLKG